MTDFLALSKEAFDASTSFIDSNFRNDWDYSLRAFRNEHAPGSKYLSEEYKNRSRIFHPKTRSIIRKNEAAAMQAAFSNREMVQTTPGNPDDPMSVASAAALKEVMQYRLTKTLPTFELYVGGVQDAQTTGVVASYQYWEYQQRPDGTILKDRPCVEIRPVENLRFDAAASWTDPVNSSPYLCDILPFYVCDVRGMMKNKDAKTGAPKWKTYPDSVIEQARPDGIDTTHKARIGNQQDPERESTGIKSFDIVWVMRWFMRDSQCLDHVFYTLGTDNLLTDAKPLEEVYFHKIRPYVMGCAILETHKAVKSSLPIIIKPLQQGINQISNSRFDNVQLVLNKRYYVARGRQTDVQSLVRNVAGGVTLTSDPKNDVVEANWQDVTSSAYVEHDRFAAEMDDLAGNFSPSTKVANNAVNDTLGGSRMASLGAGLMTEYLLRTVNETWWEHVLEQLSLLERYYETDHVILTICAKKAGLFPRFGPEQLQNMLTDADVDVSVDMALGDPLQRLQKFLMAIQSCIQIISTAPPGVNVKEICKEVMSNAGYRDGERFFGSAEDPRLLKAMQMLQQMKTALEGKQMELQAGLRETEMKLASTEKIQNARLQVDYKRISEDMALRNKQIDVDHENNATAAQLKHMELTKPEPIEVPEPVDPDMRQAELAEKLASVDLKEAQAAKARSEAAVAGLTEEKTAADKDKAVADAQAAMLSVVDKFDVAKQLQEVAQAVAQIAPITATVSDLGGRLSEMNRGFGALAGVVLQKKKSPVSFSGGKKAGKVVVKFDDGSEETVAVS